MKSRAWLAAAFLVACTASADRDERPAPIASPPVSTAPTVPTASIDLGKRMEATRIVENRCVVCHGCYDAPCQLKLSSQSGLERGAISLPVYDTGRLEDAAPTRLDIDETTVAGWRARGFHGVRDPGATGDRSSSLMAELLALGREAPVPANLPVPDSLPLHEQEAWVCPKPGAVADYAEARPLGGMPYGMAALPADEYATLMDWIVSGTPMAGHEVAIPPSIAAEIAAWERFLNAADDRSRLVARYLYEHLFLGRLHVEGDDPRRFFRLIRSSTPPGEPHAEIATRRPFDDPGPAFHYRLVPVEETILHKDHIVYPIGPARRARLRSLFFAPDWTTGPMPPWGIEAGSNPFVVFADIPAESRYRFMLDDALFFVRTFIRGPVCHGQVATDVIEDRFWVGFLSPDWDLSVTDPAFLEETASMLRLPVETAGDGLFGRLRPVLHDGHTAWLRARDARYAASARHRDGFPLDAVWDGGGTNRNALLTVFRNHDNAAVTTGFVGAVPETAWILDFPAFERIYYDLVAGYDVFGSVEHQLTTRLYMDHLRREGEALFLSFLPLGHRQPLHESWYRGALAELHASWTGRIAADTRPAAIAFRSDDPKGELLMALLARGDGLWPVADTVNRCGGDVCSGAGPTAAALSAIAGRSGPWVAFLPDVTLLRILAPDGSAEVVTLFRDRAHENVALLFDEESRLEPEKDIVTVLDGQLASYPNFFMTVAAGELDAFVARLTGMAGRDDWLRLVARHGHRRSALDFWAASDAMNAAMRRQDPLQAGLLDLGRYASPR